MAGHEDVRHTPFAVAIDDERLDDLQHRLRLTRLPSEAAGQDPRFGLTSSYLRAFVEYWADEYDWRSAEADINGFPNFTVTLDGQLIHFIHERGVGPAPLPLVLTHGWPWSFWDYRKVIGPLTDPAAHGGDPADAFDVVVPSLPGYCFSSPLRAEGASARETASLWVRLMGEVLGYGRFGTAGGDWGAIVSAILGYEHAASVLGLYVTLADFAPALRNRFEPFLLADLGDEEREWYEANFRHRLPEGQTFVPSSAPNTRRPHNEAYPGFDSPLGLAVKIIEARERNGDTRGELESVFTRQELVTNVMLYWLTDTWPSSHRLYWHTARDPVPPPADGGPLISVPTGVGVFPGEVFYVPRRAVERDVNLTFWSYHTAGGHFAACEQPQAFVDDVRRFFRPLRRGDAAPGPGEPS